MVTDGRGGGDAMFIRKLQRELAVVAIAACAPLVFGCASTWATTAPLFSL